MQQAFTQPVAHVHGDLASQREPGGSQVDRAQPKRWLTPTMKG